MSEISSEGPALLLEALQSLPALKTAGALMRSPAPLGETPPLVLANVCPAARAPLLAALARSMPGTVLWVLTADAREQEDLFAELEAWIPGNVLFLPDEERSLVAHAVPNPETTAERLHFLQNLLNPGTETNSGARVALVTSDGWQSAAPSPEKLHSTEEILRRGARLDLESFVQKLDAAGFEITSQVIERGQVTRRGGILDLFPWNLPRPIRIELWEDQIESIREFDLDDQTSIKSLEVCSIVIRECTKSDRCISDYASSIHILSCFQDIGLPCHLRILDNPAQGASLDCGLYPQPVGRIHLGEPAVAARKLDELAGLLQPVKKSKKLSPLQAWVGHPKAADMKSWAKLEELCPKLSGLTRHIINSAAAGFHAPAAGLLFLSSAELFGKTARPGQRLFGKDRDFYQGKRGQIDFSELHQGDLVVHLQHGIGRYHGIQSDPSGELGSGGRIRELMVVEYANEARLFVPLEQAYLLSRYVGLGKRNPPLSALGENRWNAARKAAEKAVYDYAGKLLQIQAQRETGKGHAFEADTSWQRDFESAFPYRETLDQLRAISATKTDMESERPMDRLICGDVGFGKTEVAIRAAFKSVMGGKQVAFLVPTTVLAQQHFENFVARMAEFPVKIGLLSRFRSASEQRQTVREVAVGAVDIVIGTHRLLQSDVCFKDLGLVIVDEEQRFGVLHKERLKERFALVDLLTLSATPIPRTLYLALTGAKEMSTIETAPPNRYPVETVVCAYDERVIREAIKRELKRGGQVYFLHNRVQSIEKVRDRLAFLVPKARLDIGHGQMAEGELEGVMHRFVAGETDVLIATTIIESGLDIPNANTILIDRADMFGLADLYQLRGRVGRSGRKAYAYLLLPPQMLLESDAKRRMGAIRQYSNLGAGFKIAMRDLEIRGAGNILGTAQSGHITAVGFDLYCQLLKQAIARMKGDRTPARIDVAVSLDFVVTEETSWSPEDAPKSRGPAYIPAGFLPDPGQRVQAYRVLAGIGTVKELQKVQKDWRDRFGRLPDAVLNLLAITEIRIRATRASVTRVEVRELRLMLTRNGQFVQFHGRFPRLTGEGCSHMLREICDFVAELHAPAKTREKAV